MDLKFYYCKKRFWMKKNQLNRGWLSHVNCNQKKKVRSFIANWQMWETSLKFSMLIMKVSVRESLMSDTLENNAVSSCWGTKCVFIVTVPEISCFLKGGAAWMPLHGGHPPGCSCRQWCVMGFCKMWLEEWKKNVHNFSRIIIYFSSFPGSASQDEKAVPLINCSILDRINCCLKLECLLLLKHIFIDFYGVIVGKEIAAVFANP